MSIKQLNTKIGQRGISSLVGVLMLITLSGLLGTTLLSKVSQESISGAMDLPELESKAGTYAGLEYALAMLRRGNDPDTSGEVISLTNNTGFSIATNPQAGAGYATISASAITSGIRSSTITKSIQALYSRSCIDITSYAPEAFPLDNYVNISFSVDSGNCNVDHILAKHLWLQWHVCGDSMASCDEVDVQDMDDADIDNGGTLIERIVYKEANDDQWLELFNNNTGANGSLPGQVRGGVKERGMDIPNQILTDGNYTLRVEFRNPFYQNRGSRMAGVKMALFLGFQDNSITYFNNNDTFTVAEADGMGAPAAVDCGVQPDHPDCAVEAQEEADGTGQVDCNINPDHMMCGVDEAEPDGLPADCDSNPDMPECAPDPAPAEEDCVDPSKCNDPCSIEDNPDLCYICLASQDASDACKPYQQYYPPTNNCSDLATDAERKACGDCVNGRPDSDADPVCDPYKDYELGGQEGGGTLQ